MFATKTTTRLSDTALPIGTSAHPMLAAMADHLTGRKPERDPKGCEGTVFDDGVLVSLGPGEPFHYVVRTADGWRSLATVHRATPALAELPMTRIPDPERERLARLRRDREEQRRREEAAAREAQKRALEERQREWARYVRESAEAYHAQHDVELRRAREIGQRHERMYGREREAAA